MADVETNDIIRTVLKSTLNGASEIDNVLHFKYTGAAALSNTQALADMQSIWDAVLDQLESFQTHQLVYDTIYAYNETKEAPMGSTSVFGHANGSETTTHEMPAHVAAGWYALTAVSRAIGKKFFGGFTELNNISGGLVDTDLVAALANAAAFVYDTTLTVNAHEYSGGIFRKATKVLIPVVETVINNIWYSQRRRRRGVGA